MKWDVVINRRPYEVWRIPGYCHTIGGRWGHNEYWCCPRDEAPSYDNLIQFNMDSPVRYGVHIDENAWVSTKWDETEARSNYTVTITRNDETFYRFPAGSIAYGYAKAYLLITEINEGPINWATYDYLKEVLYRKVRYNGKEYTTYLYMPGQCCIMLRPGRYEPEEMIRWLNSEEYGFARDDEHPKIDILEDKRIDWYSYSTDEEY